MLKSPVIAVGLVLTVVCSLLYVYEPPLITTLSHRAYDTLLHYNHKPPQSDRVAIVDLDEESLQRYGQWPWPRYLVAELTDQIMDAGASVVAFDIVFAERDRTSPDTMVPALNDHFGLHGSLQEIPGGYRDFDTLLASSLARGKTVLGCWMHQAENDQPATDVIEDESYRGWFYSLGRGHIAEHIFQAERVTQSLPELRASAANSAFYNTVPHFDSIVRDQPLIWAYGEHRIYPTLALEAVRLDQDIQQVGIRHDETGILGIQLGDRFVPTDATGRMMINYRTSTELHHGTRFTSFPSFKAADVLEGNVEAEDLRGKIVLVGTSAPGLRDMRATPLTAQANSYFSGVEINATIIDNLLTGDFLRHPTWMRSFDLAAIVLLGLTLTLVIYRQRSWFSFLVAAAALGFSISISLACFQLWHLVFTPVRLMVSIAIIYPTLTTVSFWKHERQERWIRGAFGAMVSDKVLSFLESNPHSDVLKGSKSEATILFSDIEGFSRIAEHLSPDQLSDLLNRYFKPMTEIILARDGYVDKYIGDMIMAEWGVPYQVPHHAEQACHAALEQIELLDAMRPELKKLFGHELRIRIGINSGVVTAGNMGSNDRFQYSVMGDSVNLAARLEPLNKEYGTTVILGEATQAQVGDLFETRLLDRVIVPGKSTSVAVYELLGQRGQVASGKIEAVALYEQALHLNWQGEWEPALLCLHECLRILPGDKPSAKMIEFITQCKAEASDPGRVKQYFKRENFDILRAS